MDETETWDSKTMSFDEFWAYVELCKKDPDAFRQKVEQFNEQEFIDLCWMYKIATAEIADYENFEHFEDNPPSEDHMEDLAWWCIDQGREYYYQALADTKIIPRDIPDNKPSVYSVALKFYLDVYEDYPYNPDELQTAHELYKYVNQLAKERAKNKRNLEYYLLALLKQIEAYKHKPQINNIDIMVCIRNSFKGEMANYSNDWVTLSEDQSRFRPDSYEEFERTLKIYITDLHYIRTSIKHAFASSFRNEQNGIKGRGGILWQRTDVVSFLTTGVSGLENETDGELQTGWGLFEMILVDGVMKE